MSESEAKETWDAFSQEQKTLIELELTLVYTEVLNDFINSNSATPSQATGNHLRSSVDCAASDPKPREPCDAVRAA